MNHDARIIRLGGGHPPATVRKWIGDSIGRWEGDTLVVDTTNFREQSGFSRASENLHVVERFTRIDANTLLYQFTVEDPKTWTKPWSGEYPWPATAERVFEYACHEGNYALGNIMRGARILEAEAAGEEGRGGEGVGVERAAPRAAAFSRSARPARSRRRRRTTCRLRLHALPAPA